MLPMPEFFSQKAPFAYFTRGRIPRLEAIARQLKEGTQCAKVTRVDEHERVASGRRVFAIDEYSFRYSHRNDEQAMFKTMMERVVRYAD